MSTELHPLFAHILKAHNIRPAFLDAADRRQTQRRAVIANLLTQAERRHNERRRAEIEDDRAEVWKEDWKADRIAEDRDRDTANWGQR